MKTKLFLMLLAVVMAVIAGTASAATVTTSTSAPIVTSTDESNLVAQTTTLKWFDDIEHNAGQTFTPSEDLSLKSFTIRLGQKNDNDAADEWLNFRLGTITRPGGVFTFTDIYAEEAHWDMDWLADDYVTFTLDVPQAVTGGVEYGVILDAQEMGSWYVGIPYLSIGGNGYAGGNAIGRGAARADDLVFHTDLVNPLQPQPIAPQEGVTVDAGNVDLIWANIDPNNSNPLYIDVLFGTDPCSLGLVVDGVEDATTVTVNAPAAGTYYWQVNSDIGTSIIEGPLFIFYVIDTDSDGFPDEYELLYTDPPSGTALNPGDDLEPDGLTNMEEYLLGTIPNVFDTDGDTLGDGEELVGAGLRPATNPLLADTDADGYNDGVETNTGTFVSSADTGTNPADADTDGDGLKDGVETNTGVFVNETDTGTNPFVADSDSDGAEDWYEVAASYTDPTNAGDLPVIPYPLPDPDTTPPATNKPVKVYIMAGQSNMVGFGRISGSGPGYLSYMCNTENKFPNLVNETGAWNTRNDVMYRGVISCIGDDYLRPGFGADGSVIGPEFGFGQVMGYYHDEPVLLIKSSIGNRSLSWDYAPPSTPRVDWTDGYTYAGYSDSPNRWLTGTGPTPYVWYCGKQWDDCFLDEADMGAPAWADATDYPANCQVTNNGVIYISKLAHTSSPASEPGVGVDSSANWNVYSVFNVTNILDNFATEYPQYAAQGFEIAGYAWWQGHKDQGEPFATLYEQNMVNFINDIRDYYETRYPANTVTKAPFVLATVAFDGGWDNTSEVFLKIANAQLAVTDPNNVYGFKGNVKTVEARGYWRDGSISPSTTGYHYNHNAETYMLVGDALGRAMIELDGAFAVNAGDDMVTWSGEPVVLDATVQAGVTVSSYSWSAVSSDPGNTTIGFSATDVEDPTITITKTGEEAVTVTVTLTVDDGENPPVSSSMAIEVYDDACQAARIGKELADDYPADFVDEDCVIGLAELAEMASKWLDVKGLSAPQHL